MSLLRALCFAVLLSTVPLAAQWSADPAVNTEVVARSGDQALPKSGVTSDGGRWVAWFDNASGNYDVYAQRFDAKGNEFFAAGGIPVSTHSQSSSLVNWSLLVDSSDNMVVAFTDTRNGSDLDVVTYRVASDGTFLWGPDGVILSANNDFEADPMVAEASNGDFVVVWSRSGAQTNISMQRLTPAGTPLLALGGLAVASEAGAAPGFAEVVAGSSGDVVVSWVRDINFFTSIKHLRAQAFTSTGAPAWPSPVEVYDAANLPFAYSPQLLADGAGGAVLCWHVSSPSRGFLFDTLVQHLDASGTETLPHNGTAVSSAVGMNHLSPRATFNASTGKILVFWSEKDSGQSQSGWFAQQVDAAGTLDWGATGVEILPVDSATKFLSYVEAVGDGAVSAMTWAPSGGYGQDEIIATRLDSAGVQVWGGPVDLCTIPSAKSTRLSMSVSDAGEAVVFWEDDRSGNDDVFAQNIDADGDLGATFIGVDVASVSLGAGGTATLSLDAGSAFAGNPYLVLGSNTGTLPGINGFGIHLDLNVGPYFQLTWTQPTHPLFTDLRGTLDAEGKATALVTFPAGTNPALVGTTLGHALLVQDGGGVGLASGTVSFDLVN